MLTILVSVLLLVNGYFAYPFPGLNMAQRDALDSASGAQHSTTSRETIEVVWSCLATTISCTWIAIHPNMHFSHNVSWTGQTLRRLYLVVLALLAPEIMFAWAYRQHLAAGEINENINKLASNSTHSGWTKTHAHFLQMGGFRLNCSEKVKEKYKEKLIFHDKLPDGSWLGVLTYDALRSLMEDGNLKCPSLSISKEEIEDKSKGDAVFKALAILQLLWFIVQIAARASVHLVVTNIELTTSVLATAAIFMYWCWWDKPLDAQCPVVLHLSDLKEPSGTPPSTTHNNSRTSNQMERSEGPPSTTHNNSDTSNQTERNLCQERQDRGSRSCSRALARLVRPLASTLGLTIPPERNPWYKLGHICRFYAWHFIVRPVSSFINHILIWPSMSLSCTLESNTSVRDRMTDYAKNIVTILYTSYLGTPTPKKVIVWSVVIFGFVFGGVHCAAWTYTFPTRVEQTVWRVSACIITTPFAVLLAMALGRRIANMARGKKIAAGESNASAQNQVSRRTKLIGAYYVYIIAVLIYCTARASILVISITSLRKLPPTALQTVNWLNLIPHL